MCTQYTGKLISVCAYSTVEHDPLIGERLPLGRPFPQSRERTISLAEHYDY
ncbi:hypothetical protein ACFTAO_32965 [Paenibacillus rhizoplanae]